MKKLYTGWLAAVLAAFALLATGCSHEILGGTYTGSKDVKKVININIDNYSEYFTDSSTSRTIVMDAVEADDTSFYLWGTAVTGNTQAPIEIKNKTGSSGTINLALSPDTWDLTLAVCETHDLTAEGAILADAMLVGYATIDMTRATAVTFTLSPKDLVKVGTVDLTLKPTGTWPADMSNYTITADILDLQTGAPIGSFEETINDADWVPAGVQYTADGKDVNPGTYEFAVTFENNSNHKKYKWSDVIIILPGRENTATVNIENIIGLKPENITSFNAGYIAGTEDVHQNMYAVEFAWDADSIKNETNFILQIADISDGEVDFDTGTAGTDFEEYKLDITSASEIYKKGSLRSNSSAVTVYLELGKKYNARLAAENDVGISDFIDVAVDSDISVDATKKIDAATAFTPSTVINRLRITYNLEGGVLSPDGTAALRTTTNEYIVYACMDETAGIEILNPTGDAPSTPSDDLTEPYLVMDALKFAKWIQYNPADGSEAEYPTYTPATATDDASYDPDDYKDFKNLELFARYGGEANWEIFSDKLMDIQEAWLTVNEAAVTSLTEVSKSATKDTGAVFKFLPAAVTGNDVLVTGFTYDLVTFQFTRGTSTYMAGQAEDVAIGGAGCSFKVITKNLPTGRYIAKFTAIKDKTTVNYTAVINLGD